MASDLTLQEIITRGRFAFHNSPRKLEVFELLNGKRTIKEIAEITNRNVPNIHRDIRSIENLGLIESIRKSPSNPKKDRSVVYQKIPLAREINRKYFINKKPILKEQPISIIESNSKKVIQPVLSISSDIEVLEIARSGETQIYEFKSDGTDVKKITKEIAAMLHTRRGGIVLIGIEDDGTIEGNSISFQEFDQRIQNSVRNSISPPPVIILKKILVMGFDIFFVIVKPWDKETIYQYSEKYFIRKGTNTFVLKPDELKKLHKGEYIY